MVNGYSESIVPLIHGMVPLRSDILAVQDNASSHKPDKTMREFRERDISPIEWPPYSPDDKPIEHVWNLMKNYIQVKYPDLDAGKQRSPDDLGRIVKEAWDQTANERDMEELIDSMPRRIRAVLEAAGGPS